MYLIQIMELFSQKITIFIGNKNNKLKNMFNDFKALKGKQKDY